MFSDFMLAGLGSVGATVFTNPLEVIKTRIQLQGELAARGTYVVPYKSVFSAFVTVVRNEGWMSLQKGLVPALYFQFVLNSFRLSIYNMAVSKKWVHDSNGKISFSLGLFWGSAGGMVGAIASSPFFLVKTQLQSQAAKEIAVGHQHEHTSMTQALLGIYKQGGIVGLWRGTSASVLRSVLGSGMQIGTFGSTKAMLYEYDLVRNRTMNSFAAGVIAGSAMTVVMNPSDVITTRLYNQGVDASGKGLYYSGWLDCLVKVFRSEGLYGLYKGFWPNYLRIAPHSTLVLLFFDELIALRDNYFRKKTL